MSNNAPTMDDFLSDNSPSLDEEQQAPSAVVSDKELYVAPQSTVELSTLSHPPIEASFSSLPHPEEIPRENSFRVVDNKPPLLRRKSFWWIAAGAALILLVLVLGVSLGVSSSRSSGSSSQSPSINTLSLSEVADWIVENGISSRSAVLAEGTPQNQAAKYLTTLDASQADTKTSKDAYLQAAKYVMAVFYYSTKGDEWLSSLNFMKKDDICEWIQVGIGISETGLFETEFKGVLCNDEAIPIALDVERNIVSGSIPTELGFLTSLELLDFEHNSLTGEIPNEFCQFPNLQLLWAQQNSLSGKLPKCEWPELITFRLASNEFTGTIPTEYCSMRKVRSFILDKSQLDGPMPSCDAEDWPNVDLLSMSDNLLTGTLATEVASLPKLKQLFVDGNALTGNPIPTVNAMTNLNLLYIEENFFTGTIDDNFAKGFDDLLALDISENNFTSTDGLPVHLFSLPELVVLDMSLNELKGTIPDDIPTQSNLKFFSVFNNQLTGSVPGSVSNLKDLLHIDVANNELTGSMPTEIFSMPGLWYIYLSENDFMEGPVPEMVGMEKMRDLSIKNTNRNGTLPTFEGFQSLVLLVLDNNRFTGEVPSNYGKLPNLRHLLLGRNPGLSGDMPEFTEPTNLGTVLVDKTGITGDFTSLCNLPTISGKEKIGTDVIVVADCDDADSGITCDCCQCCSWNQPVCSEPRVTSLDWTWENGLRRTARNFAINYTLFEDDPSVSPS